MRPLNKKAIKIAEQVRKQCYAFAMSHHSSKFDFHGKRDLWCMCMFASTVLRDELQKKGHKAILVVGRYDCLSHAWVQIRDHIIDITATQFKGITEEVYLTTEENDWYSGDDYFEDDHPDWGEWQTPTPKAMEKTLDIAPITC